jgi:hypothetical protein
VFLRSFKSSFASQYFIIAVTGILLWCRAVTDPVLMPEPEGPAPLYAFLYGFLSGHSRIAAILGFLLILGSSVFLNYIFNKHDLVTKNSSLAAFLFIILASYHPCLLTIHPVSIALFILLLIFHQLFETYHQAESLELFYAAGLFAGIGSFFYFPFIVFYFFIIISFIVFRSNNWREWTASFLGLLTPYLFLSVYYFWSDKFALKSAEYQKFFHLPQDLRFDGDAFLVGFTVILLFLVLFSLINSLAHLSERTLEGRKKSLLLFWSVFFILLSFPFSGRYYQLHLQFLVIIVSALLTSFFLQRRKTFWHELFLLMFMAAVLLNNLIFHYI